MPADRLERCVVICRAIIRDNSQLVSCVHWLTPDDLLQEALLAANRADASFKATKGNYNSWIGRAVKARLIDISRVRARDLRRTEEHQDEIIQTPELTMSPPADEDPAAPPREVEVIRPRWEYAGQHRRLKRNYPPVAWSTLAAACMEDGRRIIGSRYGQKPSPEYSPAAMWAIACLREYWGVSGPRAVSKLATTKDLLAVLGIDAPPTRQNLSKIEKKFGREAFASSVKRCISAIQESQSN
jgi:hypothetical protein